MNRLVVLAGLVVVILSVAACTDTTTGRPTTATTGGGQTSGSQPTATSTSSGGTGSLPVDQPCSLLSSGELQEIGVSSQPTQDMVGTAHACELDTANFHIIVGIRTNVGLAGLTPTAPVTSTTISGRPAKEQKNDSASSCLIAIGVSNLSRVDVTATGDGTTNPCPTAESVAKLVAPKLP